MEEQNTVEVEAIEEIEEDENALFIEDKDYGKTITDTTDLEAYFKALAGEVEL